MNTETRKYKVSDAHMQEHSKTMRTHFIDNQADFSGFDTDFTTPFETGWQSAVDAATAILPDEVIIDQLTQLTADVDNWMNQCRNKYQDSKYFIEKAFPDNQPVWNEFGGDNYDGQRRDQRGMIEFMRVFFATATKYATELNAAGYDAAAIAEIDTLRVRLDDANTAQEAKKGERGVIAQDRVQANNALWEITTRVSQAGKVIYRTDPARYNLFLLPASDEPAASLSINGTITDSGTSAPIADATIAIVALGVEVSSDSNGNYAIASLDDGAYELQISASGYTTQTIADVAVDGSDDTPTNLNVQMVATP